MKKNRTASGFTLIELLIGMIIFGMILSGIIYLTTSITTASTNLNINNSVIKEGQIAQQIISGRLSEAIYVWGAGRTTSMVFGTSGVTTLNTTVASPSYAWKIGNGTLAYFDPASVGGKVPYSSNFIAMILPPENPTVDATGKVTNCNKQEPTVTASSTITTDAATTTDGCYRFFAYFPMRRSYIVNSSLAASNKPLADKFNDFSGDITKDRWVLMEYRANLYSSSAGAWTPGYDSNYRSGVSSAAVSLTTLQSYYLGRSANILVDYVKPGSVSFTVYRPGLADATGAVDPTAGPNSNPNGRVDYSFQLERFLSNKAISATPAPLGGSITLKNWYCPKAMVPSPFTYNCP